MKQSQQAVKDWARLNNYAWGSIGLTVLTAFVVSRALKTKQDKEETNIPEKDKGQ